MMMKLTTVVCVAIFFSNLHGCTDCCASAILSLVAISISRVFLNQALDILGHKKLNSF